MRKAQIGHVNVYQIDSHLIISPSGKNENVFEAALRLGHK